MSWIVGEGTDYDRQFNDRTLIRRYFKFVRPYWRYLIIVIVAILISTVFTLLVPLTLQEGVDALIDGNADLMFQAAGLFIILNLLAWISDAIQTYYNTKFTARSTEDLRNDLFSRVQAHDLSFFDRNKTAKILTRIMDDTTIIAEFVTLSSRIVTSLVIALGIVVILFYINFWLTVLALSVVPFLIIGITLFRRVARRLARTWRASVSELNDSFQENISGIKVAKAFGKQDQSKEEFERLNQENFVINFKKSAFFASIFPMVFAISNVGLFLVLYSGGRQAVIDGTITPGTIILYVAYLQRFYFPILLITNFYNQLQSGLAAAERIFSLMDVESNLDRSGTKKLDLQKLSGKLEFREIEFSYDDSTKVFDKFSLTIQPGETVALVGHTGAGKSSIISILSRYYELNNGQIFLDGIDIKEYDLYSYRSCIGMVLQDPLLFSGTIRSNIAYGLPNASDDEIMMAAKYANLLDFIESQSNGLDTQIEERGRRLSQGQKQLISLARAFLVNPRLLLLDEATASIDAYSEALIQESIDTLLHDRTSLVIAHRLTTIQRVDRIVVLDHGRVLEEGNHEELLAKNGHYANLYQKYFAFQEVTE